MFVVFVFLVGYLYGVWKEADKTYDTIQESKQMEEKYLIKCKQYLELATWFDEAVEQLEDCKAKHPKKYY